MGELGLNDQDGQKSAISRTLSVTFLIHVPHVLLLAPAILVAGNSDPGFWPAPKLSGLVVIPGADQKDCGLLRGGWVLTFKANTALRVFGAFKWELI